MHKTQSKTVKQALFTRVVSVAALAADPAGKLPTRMRILKWGANANSQNKVVNVGKKLIEAMSSPIYPFGQVALDFEHNTWSGSAEYKRTNEPRPVAAFLSVECVENDGVYVTVDRWTPTGEKDAVNFCDLSAVPLMDKDGNVTSIVSVALTRAGSVPDITFAQALAAQMETENNNPEGKDEMNYKELMCKLLGIDSDSTDEALQSAMNAYLDKQKAAEEKPSEAAAMSATEIAGIVTTAVSASTAALSARLDSQDKQRVITDAMAEGKVVALSAELVAKLSLDDLKKHCAALPLAVPLSALTPITIAEGKTVALSATEIEVCKNLGLSTEAYAKEKGVK